MNGIPLIVPQGQLAIQRLEGQGARREGLRRGGGRARHALHVLHRPRLLPRILEVGRVGEGLLVLLLPPPLLLLLRGGDHGVDAQAEVDGEE
jgi:hypothetical protein